MGANPRSLRANEQDLLREIEPERMAELSEEELVALHRRIRRARNKYVGIYRRTGSQRVSDKGGRGMAKQKNTRNAGRADVFEDALERVSDQLAAVDAAQAAELKAERLAAASPQGDWPGAQVHANSKKANPKVMDRQPKGAGLRKRKASSQAQGVRRQAKRDAR